jgi:hypothetical protein
MESYADSNRVGGFVGGESGRTKDEVSSEPCLHCEINKVVREHIEGAVDRQHCKVGGEDDRRRHRG